MVGTRGALRVEGRFLLRQVSRTVGRFLALAPVGTDALICPSCALREVDTPSGFCTDCVLARAADSYAAADRNMAATRADEWRKRTNPDAHVVTLRQQRSRALRRLRPTEPAGDADPWALALAALDRCKAVDRANPAHRRDMEAIAETLRRLAWGPDDDAPMRAPERRRPPVCEGQMVFWEARAVVGQSVIVTVRRPVEVAA